MTQDTDKFNKFNLETIVKMVKNNPNNSVLGELVRNYVRSNVKIDYINNNQLSLDFGSFEDVEDED